MKPWLKWTLAAVVVALLGAGAARTLAARKVKQQELQAQQTAQRTQVAMDLRSNDLRQVRALELALTVPLSGPIQAVNTALVKARVGGELQGLTVREGDLVRAGQVLGRIDPTEFDARLRQARQQAQAAKAQADIAQRSHDNNQALVAQGFISSTALAASQANLAAAHATYAAALAASDIAAKTLGDALLRAPISGQISQRLAQPGERVSVEARIVEIVDLGRLELAATLPVADALQVKPGQLAHLQVEGTETQIAARVARINPSAAPGSRAVLVYLAIEPGVALRHGLYAQGSLAVGRVTANVVPLTALRTDQPQPYLQLVQDGKVKHAQVTPGPRSEVDGQTLVAVTGVPAGAVVIAGSVGVLRPGTPVRLVAEK
ncbi:MAG: efflux RND transporter periplasmic adaptor subunit [Rhodoferax sp.]|nr:efflux RND transporter periplasmic adaptor subunit [Rhodoferax sp.]